MFPKVNHSGNVVSHALAKLGRNELSRKVLVGSIPLCMLDLANLDGNNCLNKMKLIHARFICFDEQWLLVLTDKLPVSNAKVYVNIVTSSIQYVSLD
jgi:hypothetical protein